MDLAGSKEHYRYFGYGVDSKQNFAIQVINLIYPNNKNALGDPFITNLKRVVSMKLAAKKARNFSGFSKINNYRIMFAI